MKAPARRFDRVDWGLWLGLLVPPAAWFGAQQAGFLLASWVCDTGNRWVLFAVTGSALLVAAAAGGAAWRRWTADRDGSSGTRERRRRHLAAAGVILSLFFLLAIAAFAIPDLIQRPCD